MTLPYSLNIPFATNDPSVDQPDMLENTNSTSTLIQQDHLGFNNQFNGIANSGGYHTNIHMIDQGAGFDPARITQVGQLFAKEVTLNGFTDVALFYRTGTNVGFANSLTQITAPKNTVTGNNGYTFLPGGMIVQWGIINPYPTPLQSATTIPLVFNIPYPTACVNVQMTLINDTSTSNAQVMSVRSSSVSNTGFSWNYTGGSAYRGFYWMALGY